MLDITHENEPPENHSSLLEKMRDLLLLFTCIQLISLAISTSKFIIVGGIFVFQSLYILFDFVFILPNVMQHFGISDVNVITYRIVPTEEILIATGFALCSRAFPEKVVLFGNNRVSRKLVYLFANKWCYFRKSMLFPKK